MELGYSAIKNHLNVGGNSAPLPDLIGRRVGYSNPRLPGFYHVHHLHDYSVKYMDPETCLEFNATLEEIQALGGYFQALVTHPEDVPRVQEALFSFAARADEQEVLTYFQRIRLRPDHGIDGYNLVLTCVRLDLAEQAFICLTNTTDQLPVFTAKICNALNQHFETREQMRQYLQLTTREREVFACLVQSQTAQQVADALIVSVHTVEQHKKNIYRKLGIHRVGELITLAKNLELA